MKTGSPLFFLFLCCLLCSGRLNAQSYGLGFYSHEVVQDQRTGLDLSPAEPLCFSNNFEISFDLTLFPARRDYFGYVLRLVADNNENIDLIYDKNATENSRFKIIIGERYSNIAFNIPAAAIFSKWNRLKLSFDDVKQELTVTNGRSTYHTKIKLRKNSCFKVLFGANEYLDFKTTDVPPMKIRNVSILEDGTAKYFWPLNESAGTIAHEELNGKHGQVIKPLWVRKLHYEWQPLLRTTINGPASIAFDPKNELLYVIGDDSLINYEVSKSTVVSTAYASGKQNLLRGNQSLVDANGRLVNFYIDRQTVSIYDPETKRWTANFDPRTNITDFWLCNKFYSTIDSSLYIIGGYGHFIYKNKVQQYHFPGKVWKDANIAETGFTPRYLAALGKSGNGAYILGGYGSSSGQQMLNPRNLYDLLYFDVQEKTIKKIYELKIKGEDFVFANSMVINEKEKSYYALKFPKNKYQSSLQLIEGSLTRPEFKLRGNPIPYLFHDVRSYADLFYCPGSKKFIAVTLYWEDNNKTRVSIYALNAPAVGLETEQEQASNTVSWYWTGGLVLLAVGGMCTVLVVKRKKSAGTLPVAAASDGLEIPLVVEEQQIQHIHPAKASGITANQNAVFLFGDMQVFDKEGIEITRQFTPLIRELFLVILIYSVRWGRGISSEKLKELLWFDKTEESARNNRSVSIVKLKNIIDRLENCTISKDTGYWKLSFNPESTYIDYQKYVSIIKNKKTLDKAGVLELAELVKRGSFLPNASYEWLDTFKAEVSNEVIDTYLHFAHSLSTAEDAELLVELANYIFYFDAVNEEAMVIKCKALAGLGKHSQSKQAYENFCKEYKLLYDDGFHKGFGEVLNS
jgi:DNA-binding SARP family transcriptional activator